MALIGSIMSVFNVLKIVLLNSLLFMKIRADCYVTPTSDGHVTIDSSTTVIAESAFYKCKDLKSITLPEGLLSIERWAFAQTSLEDITIPTTVIDIGDYAFYKNDLLKTVDILDRPPSAALLLNRTFEGCTDLQSAVIGEGVDIVGCRAFEGCTSLITVNLSSSVTVVGIQSFYGCTALTSVNFLPNSNLHTIEKNAFSYCNDLVSIDIPGNVTSIEGGAFGNCASLMYVTMGSPNTNLTVGGYCFEECGELRSILNKSPWVRYDSSYDADTDFVTYSPVNSTHLEGLEGTFCDKDGYCTCIAGWGAIPNVVEYEGFFSCRPCPTGTYNMGLSRDCTLCNVGKYMPPYIEEAKSEYSCRDCLPGTFQYLPGMDICTPAEPGSFVGSSGMSAPSLCPINSFSSKYGASVCTPCDDGYITESKGANDCFASSSVKGVFANKGAPFYVLAILSTLAGGLGLALFYNKMAYDSDPESLDARGVLVQQPLTKHISACFFGTAGFLSELVLAFFALQSGLIQMRVPASMLLISRFLVASVPTLILIFVLVIGRSVDRSTSTPTTPNDEIPVEIGIAVQQVPSHRLDSKFFLHEKLLFTNSKLYVMLLLLALFEPPVISLMPWYLSPFVEVAGFPNMAHLQLFSGAKFAQIVITSVAQIMIGTSVQNRSTGVAFLLLLYLNIIFSVVTFFFRIAEFALKWNILQESDLSDDVSASRALAQRKPDIDNIRGASFMEMVTRTSRSHLHSTITPNPLHKEAQPRTSTVNVTLSAIVEHHSTRITTIENQIAQLTAASRGAYTSTTQSEEEG